MQVLWASTNRFKFKNFQIAIFQSFNFISDILCFFVWHYFDEDSFVFKSIAPLFWTYFWKWGLVDRKPIRLSDHVRKSTLVIQTFTIDCCRWRGISIRLWSSLELLIMLAASIEKEVKVCNGPNKPSEMFSQLQYSSTT